MVRGAIIKYIDEGAFEDEFNYVLHSHKILTKSDYRVMAGLERLYLNYLGDHLSESNAESMLLYFTANKEEIKELTRTASYQDENRPVNRLYQRLSELFIASKKQSILDAFIGFLNAIHYASHKKDTWGNPAVFFADLEGKERLFWMLLLHPQVDQLDHFLADLYSESLDTAIINAYKSSEINADHIKTIRCALCSRNREAHDHFQNLLLANFGDTFKYQESLNWDEIRVQRDKRDLELLQNREEFLLEAKNFYKLIKAIKGDEADEHVLHELEWNEKKEVRKKVNNTLILRAVSEYKIKGGLNEFVSYFDQTAWEWYVFQEVEQRLVHSKKEALPPTLLSFAENHLKERVLPHINLKDAIKDKSDDSYTINSYAGHIINYYRNGVIRLPETVQLDMLWLDYDGYAEYPDTGQELPRKLFEIIHVSTDQARFKNRILANMANKKLSSFVLASHAFACRQYQYEEAVPTLMALLERKSYPDRFKEELVKIIIDLSDDPEIFGGCIAGWKTVRQPWQLGVINHQAKLPAYESQLAAMIERSDLNPFLKDIEHFWKHKLIVAGIRLGSLKSAHTQFTLFKRKLRTFDHSPLKVADFERLSTDQPDWLMAQAFQVLDKYAPFVKDSKRNELAEFMEELIRLCAITSQTRFETAIAQYEDLIRRHQQANADVIRIKYYERKLITDFYAEACSYETDDAARDLIMELHLSVR